MPWRCCAGASPRRLPPAGTWHTGSSLVRRSRPQPAGKQGARALLQEAQASRGQQVAKAGCCRGGALQAGAVGHVRVTLHLENGRAVDGSAGGLAGRLAQVQPAAHARVCAEECKPARRQLPISAACTRAGAHNEVGSKDANTVLTSHASALGKPGSHGCRLRPGSSLPLPGPPAGVTGGGACGSAGAHNGMAWSGQGEGSEAGATHKLKLPTGTAWAPEPAAAQVGHVALAHSSCSQPRPRGGLTPASVSP